MNSKNARGEYLFGGFQGKTQPYVQGADGSYSYMGDEGQRKVQIASSQELAITDNGKQIFDRVLNASRLTGNALNSVVGSTLQMGAPLVSDEVAVAEFPAEGVEIVFADADPLDPDAPRSYGVYSFPAGDPADPARLLQSGRVDELPGRTDSLVFRGVNLFLDGMPAG